MRKIIYLLYSPHCLILIVPSFLLYHLSVYFSLISLRLCHVVLPFIFSHFLVYKPHYSLFPPPFVSVPILLVIITHSKRETKSSMLKSSRLPNHFKLLMRINWRHLLCFTSINSLEMHEAKSHDRLRKKYNK